MKTTKIILLALSISLLIACSSEQKQGELPVVDVTKSYPKKEIILQDIAEVDYIPLETRDDVLIDNNYRLCTISPDSILVGNYREGSIFLFNGQGKVLQKFNRKGQSGSEYQEIWGIYYDKAAREIIVLDYPYQYRFQVYDDAGNYKRTIPIDKKYAFICPEIINYNAEAFLCYNNEPAIPAEAKKDTVRKAVRPYVLISKKDGKELGRLPISCTERVTPTVVTEFSEGGYSTSSIWMHSITIDAPNFILSEISKDTIYSYSQDKKLVPMLIRTPKVLTMEDPFVFFQIKKQTTNYFLGQITEKNPKKKPYFSKTYIAIDKESKDVFEYQLVNADAPTSNFGKFYVLGNRNDILLGMDILKEWLEEGKLKGKLKAIAENSKEDDNPVWMRVKFKNN